MQGCDGQCGLFHPTLCKNSLRYRECFDPECTFAHLSGTERFERKSVAPSQMQQVQGFATPTRMEGFGSRPNRNFDQRQLRHGFNQRFGNERFQKKISPHFARRGFGYTNTNSVGTQGVLRPPISRDVEGKQENFVYKQNEFPPLPTAQDDKINELSSAVKKMQSCLEFLMNQAKFNTSQQAATGNYQIPFCNQQQLNGSNHQSFVQQLPRTDPKN